MIDVLYLDDDLEDVAYAQRLLGEHGIGVDGHDHVDDFLIAARNHPGRIALIDWNLRRCEGTDLVADMRAEGDGRRIALVSRLLEVEHAEELSLKVGGDAFIEKSEAASWVSTIRYLAALPPRPRRRVRLLRGVELAAGGVILHGRAIPLRESERRLVELLASRVGGRASLDELAEHVFGPALQPHEMRILLASVVRGAREALDKDGAIVDTIDGGYQLRVFDLP